MISTVFAILFYTCFFGLSFIGLGQWINRRLTLNLSSVLMFPVGLASFFGVIQFLFYPVVYFQLPVWVFFICICIIGTIGIVLFFKQIQIKKMLSNRFNIVFIVFYVIMMVYISSQRTLGQNSFDTIHYLSLVMEGASSKTFSFVQLDTGYATSVFNVPYDFQSFYAFGSYLIYFFDHIVNVLSPNYLVVSANIYIWVVSVFYFILESTLVLGFLTELKVSSKFVYWALLLILLGFFGNFYYNNVYAFFGNTYRTAIVSLFIFSIFKAKTKLNLNTAIWLSLLSSSLISVSSSGLFLGMMLLTTYMYVFFINGDNTDDIGKILVILMLPTMIFACAYLGSNNIGLLLSIIVLETILILVLLMYDLAPLTLKNKIYRLMKLSVFIGIPSLILFYSLFSLIRGTNLYPNFFQDHRAYDMVWYYFSFNTLNGVALNSLMLVTLAFFLVAYQGFMKNFILFLIVLFINPLSAIFVHRFLADVVYYRSFELVFNAFTIILFTEYLLSNLKCYWFYRALSVSFMVMCLVIAVDQSSKYYHDSFIPTSKYSSLFRIDGTQADALSVLKTKIVLEGYQSARVVSQIEQVRGYVPNVITPISNESIRNIDKYQVNHESSKLLTIFENRDFIGQKIFDVEPDYAHTCDYLIQEKVDFVIVDKNQFLIDENNIVIPLYFKVRDCADSVFENKDYIIYQFYWKS